MSGIVNSTGAVSGIIGTTVGSVTAASLSGVLPSGVTGGSGLDAIDGIVTNYDRWKLTTTSAGGATPFANIARSTHAAFTQIGSGMSVSTGIFTFPATGMWWITFKWFGWLSGSSRNNEFYIIYTSDNSTYATMTYASTGWAHSQSGTTYGTGYISAPFDVTDLSNDKVRFDYAAVNTSTYTASGNDGGCSFEFFRWGDT